MGKKGKKEVAAEPEEVISEEFIDLNIQYEYQLWKFKISIFTEHNSIQRCSIFECFIVIASQIFMVHSFWFYSNRQLKERSDAASYQYTKSAKERNFMQVEVDLVQRLYDITKSEVKESAAQLIAMDRQMEMMEKDHRVNLKVYEQKVQNLSYAIHVHIFRRDISIFWSS